MPAADVPPWVTKRRLWLVVAGVAGLALLTAHRIALADFRQLEAAYVETRQPTACAFDRLARQIDPREGNPELITEDLPGFLEEASGELRDVTERVKAVDVVAFPPLRQARRGVHQQAERAIELYNALLFTPEDSRDELGRFAGAKRRAEEELGDVRVWLFVAPGKGWDQRDDCNRADA